MEVWLQLFQLMWSILELLLWLTLDNFFGIIANTNWWDTIPSKQQQQGLISFTSGCHLMHSDVPKDCGKYLCTPIASSEGSTIKHCVRVSENTECGRWQNNHLDNEGWCIILISPWVATWIVFSAFCTVMSCCLDKTKHYIRFLTIPISSTLIWIWATKADAKSQSSITLTAL